VSKPSVWPRPIPLISPCQFKVRASIYKCIYLIDNKQFIRIRSSEISESEQRWFVMKKIPSRGQWWPFQERCSKPCRGEYGDCSSHPIKVTTKFFQHKRIRAVGLTSRSESLIPDFANHRPDPQRIVLAANSTPGSPKNNCQSGLNWKSFTRNTPKAIISVIHFHHMENFDLENRRDFGRTINSH